MDSGKKAESFSGYSKRKKTGRGREKEKVDRVDITRKEDETC